MITKTGPGPQGRSLISVSAGGENVCVHGNNYIGIGVGYQERAPPMHPASVSCARDVFPNLFGFNYLRWPTAGNIIYISRLTEKKNYLQY